MGQFELYLKLGLEHILDLQGFDHILFVVALCALYLYKDWKRILILVTAFTIGHSVTLALATMNIIIFRPEIIEFLIPVTIMITAVANIIKPKPVNKGVDLNYFFALFFGLIHGLGFSSFLRSLLGKETSIFQPLLAFNIGLEIGQLIIVAVFMIAGAILINLFKVSKRDWTLVISATVLGMAFMLMLEKIFW